MRIRTAGLVAVLLTLFPLVSSAADAAESADSTDHWDLNSIYESAETWQADASRAEKQFADLAKCKGKLSRSAKNLRECLELRADIEKRLARLESYAAMQLDEDTSVAENLALTQQYSLLATRYQEASSFVRPELLAAGKAKLNGFFKQDAKLKPYRFPVDNILRAKPQVLNAAGEKLSATPEPSEHTPGPIAGATSGPRVPGAATPHVTGAQ